MLTIEQIRKTLWEDFSNLTDTEIEQIWTDMLNFWSMMLED